jgi:GTP cyclohydrolase I
MTTTDKLTLTWDDCRALAKATGETIARDFGKPLDQLTAYGVPRGGCMAGALIPALRAVESADQADLIIDDLIDSGSTKEQAASNHPSKPFYALLDKRDAASPYHGKWIEFPWEQTEVNGPEDNIRRVLQYLGENPKREGLLETPKRFLKMMRELTAGYHSDPQEHLSKRFTLDDEGSGMSGYDEVILSGPLPFVSLCEHHMAAFDGVAFIAYLPGAGGRVVGLSKLARLLDGYAQRFQVQERLTVQIADALENQLSPRGVAVVIRARHTCQCFRGVKKDGRMVTSAMRGVFRECTSARGEVLNLIRLAETR